MKHFFSKVFAILIICISTLSAFAVEYRYGKEARVLYDLGLYKGVSKIAYVPDLRSNLTREEAVTILIRLFGQKEDAHEMTSEQMDDALKKFADAENISNFAREEVAYATIKGYVKGIEVGNKIYFNPRGYLKGLDYASLILQELGITDFKYYNAIEKLREEGVISKEVNFSPKEIKRDDVVGISYRVLGAKADNGKTVLENLVDLGKVQKDEAEKFVLMELKESDD